MTKRTSIHIEDFHHVNPIPAACRIGRLLASGIVNGTDPATGKVAPTLEQQCAYMFAHVRRIVEAAGGTTDDIIKMTVWMSDRSQREALNREWLKMFPHENSRPARQAMQASLTGGILIQCDFLAVLGDIAG